VLGGALLLLAAGNAAAQADWYVDGTNGDDTNSGDSWSSPFATVQKGLSMVDSSNREIWVKVGTYPVASPNSART